MQTSDDVVCMVTTTVLYCEPGDVMALPAQILTVNSFGPEDPAELSDVSLPVAERPARAEGAAMTVKKV